MLEDRSTRRFTLGVVVSLAFSISVILGTFGIMDGFELTLKQALKGTVGDLTIHSTKSFFSFKHELKDDLAELNISLLSSQVEVEAFAIHREIAKGVKLLGIDPDSFSQVTGLKFNLSLGDVVIGSSLATHLGVSRGDMLTLALAQGSQGLMDLPQLVRVQISQIITHGIHQKDMRLIYLDRAKLQQMLGIGRMVNGVSIVIPGDHSVADYMEAVEQFATRLREHLSQSFLVRPFWHEFGVLLEAVRVERFMIGLILQIIVLIAVFNLLSFIIFLSEKRAQALFLVRALGMGRQQLFSIWLLFVLMVWGASSLLSVGMVALFNQLLHHSPWLQIPGEVYTLGQLTIILDYSDYLLVFALALLWVLLFSIPILRSIGRKSIIEGLRGQFS
jgi:ABC-type lipoprotein release transport system permease subunit